MPVRGVSVGCRDRRSVCRRCSVSVCLREAPWGESPPVDKSADGTIKQKNTTRKVSNLFVAPWMLSVQGQSTISQQDTR